MLGRFNSSASSDSDLGFPTRNDVKSGTHVEAFGCVNHDREEVPVTSRGRVLKVRSVNVQRQKDDYGCRQHNTWCEDEIVPIPRQQYDNDRKFRGHYRGDHTRRGYGWGEDEQKNGDGVLRRSERFHVVEKSERSSYSQASSSYSQTSSSPSSSSSSRPESAGSDTTNSSGTSGSQHPESDGASTMSASSASSYARKKYEKRQHSRVDEEPQRQVMPTQVTTRGFSVENPMANTAKPRSKALPPGMVRCFIERHSKGLRSTKYYMYIQDTADGDRLILAAQRQRKNGNMHIFDMTQGFIGKKLSKKHGNYIGKVSAKMGSNCHMVYGTAKDSIDSAAVIFEKDGIVDKIKDGVMPRRMCVLLPKNDGPNGRENRQAPKDHSDILLRTFRAMGRQTISNRAVRVLGNKAPVYERGNYRLNFYGRVTHASVKNFQLIERRGAEDDDEQDVLLQFGKVGSDKFNLDYNEARFSPMLAFGIALTHFNF